VEAEGRRNDSNTPPYGPFDGKALQITPPVAPGPAQALQQEFRVAFQRRLDLAVPMLLNMDVPAVVDQPPGEEIVIISIELI
jgi:hypothetical protein